MQSQRAVVCVEEEPIWVTSGGAELPLTNLAIATSLALLRPGRFSLDEALGIELPTAAGVAAGIAASLIAQPAPPEPQANEVGGELQAGEDSGGGADTALDEQSVGDKEPESARQ